MSQHTGENDQRKDAIRSSDLVANGLLSDFRVRGKGGIARVGRGNIFVPWKDEKSPSMGVKQTPDGIWHFTDFSDGNASYDVISLAARLKGVGTTGDSFRALLDDLADYDPSIPAGSLSTASTPRMLGHCRFNFQKLCGIAIAGKGDKSTLRPGDTFSEHQMGAWRFAKQLGVYGEHPRLEKTKDQGWAVLEKGGRFFGGMGYMPVGKSREFAEKILATEYPFAPAGEAKPKPTIQHLISSGLFVSSRKDGKADLDSLYSPFEGRMVIPVPDLRYPGYAVAGVVGVQCPMGSMGIGPASIHSAGAPNPSRLYSMMPCMNPRLVRIEDNGNTIKADLSRVNKLIVVTSPIDALKENARVAADRDLCESTLVVAKLDPDIRDDEVRLGVAKSLGIEPEHLGFAHTRNAPPVANNRPRHVAPVQPGPSRAR